MPIGVGGSAQAWGLFPAKGAPEQEVWVEGRWRDLGVEKCWDWKSWSQFSLPSRKKVLEEVTKESLWIEKAGLGILTCCRSISSQEAVSATLIALPSSTVTSASQATLSLQFMPHPYPGKASCRVLSNLFLSYPAPSYKITCNYLRSTGIIHDCLSQDP